MSDPSSEPLWFLDTTEEDGKKSSGIEHSGTSDSQDWAIVNTGDPLVNGSSNNQTENTNKEESGSFNDFGTQLLSSIIDLNEGNDGPPKIPEVKLTLNFDEIKKLSGEKEKAFELDDLFSENAKSSEEPESQLSEAEQKQILDNAKFEVIQPTNEHKSVEENKPSTAKVYIFLKDKSGNTINLNERFNLNDPESKNKYCEEVGSSVLSLKDLVSHQQQQNDNDKVFNFDSVLTDPAAEGKNKRVKLVLTIKDKRKNSADASNTSINRNVPVIHDKKCSSCEETARFKSLLADATSVESVLSDSFHSTFQRLKDTITGVNAGAPTNVSSRRGVTSSVQRTWSSSSGYSSGGNSPAQGDWSSETSDTWVREDGARCTRTVWSTPSGKRVKTQCVSDDYDTRRPKPRPRRRVPRDNLWGIDDELDRIFREFDRFRFSTFF